MERGTAPKRPALTNVKARQQGLNHFDRSAGEVRNGDDS